MIPDHADRSHRPHSGTGGPATGSPRYFRWLASLGLPVAGLLLSGCHRSSISLLRPDGPIAATEVHAMAVNVTIMLGVIIPTALLIIWFLWRYRASSGKGRHDPHWSHSTAIEIVVWGIPLVVVGVLGYLSYRGVYEVNPYHPTVLASMNREPVIDVDVITTDWQWLFVYPKQHIAAVDELVIPANTRVRFHLTSASVTSSFFIPRLVGQIYVMPGMRTEQSMVASKSGSYRGFSAALSGPGFSWMQFETHALPTNQFRAWVAHMRRAHRHLTYAAFDRFAKPTINIHHTPHHYSHVEPGLFDHVIEEVRMGKVFATPMAMTEHM